jgi:hypothetical protein
MEMEPATARERERPLLTTARVVWCVACALLVAWVVRSEAAQRGANLGFYPINGDWQNYNPVRRWLDGELPGRDFHVYLGLGPTWLTTLATWWCGGQFGDSLFAMTGLCVALQALCWGVVARVAGLSRTAAWSLAALSVVFFAAPYKLWLPVHLRAVLVGVCEPLFQPGNSALGLRAAAPVLATLVLWWTWNRWADVRCRPWRRALWLGAVSGAFLPWSNDYGPSTCAALSGVAALCWYRDTRWTGWLCCVVIHGLAAVLVALGVLTLATGGAPGWWWEYNFRGVATDQFWYFRGDKVLRWSQLPLWYELWIGGGTLGVWLWRMRRRTTVGTDSLLALLVLAPLLSTLVSVAGGHVEWRYAFPLARTLFIATPCAVMAVVGEVWRGRGGGAGAGSPLLTQRAEGELLSPRWDVLLCVLLALQTGILARRWFREQDRQPRPAEPWSMLVPRDIRAPRTGALVPLGDAGSGLPERFSKAVAIASELRDEFVAGDVPRESRIASTYTSLIDVIAGAKNPCRSDYLIHALGSRERTAHLEQLTASPPEYVTTIREDWVGWEGWLQRQNWPYYRWLTRYYEPFDRTYYAIVWKRRREPRRPRDWPVDSRAVALSADCVALEFRLPERTVDEIARSGVRGRVVVEAHVDYTTRATSPLWTSGVTRQSLEGVDIERPFMEWGVTDWGWPLAPNEQRTATFPVDIEPGECRTVLLSLAPAEVSEVKVSRVTARVILTEQDFGGVALPRLRAAAWTAHDWRHGVRQHGAEFLVSDASDLRDLSQGDELVFAVSGRRRIESIEGSRVRVDGAPLDPDRDGYPAPIRVVDPQSRYTGALLTDKPGDAWLGISDITHPDWWGGICVDGGRAGVFIREPDRIAELRPGDTLTFARSGERRVSRVESPIVWVEGVALDPVGDSSPEMVLWRNAPASAQPGHKSVRPVFQTHSD